MANPIETGRDYLVSVANRTVGRVAWRKAMQKPSSWDACYDNRPSWASAINEALDRAAPVYSLLELGYPLTSKSFVSIMEDIESSKFNHPYIATGKLLLALTTDIALLASTIWLTHNLGEAAAFKLATNITVQMGSDLASAAVDRIKHFRPHNTTLAV